MFTRGFLCLRVCRIVLRIYLYSVHVYTNKYLYIYINAVLQFIITTTTQLHTFDFCVIFPENRLGTHTTALPVAKTIELSDDHLLFRSKTVN